MIAGDPTEREEVAQMVTMLSATACASVRLRSAAQPTDALTYGTRAHVVDALAAPALSAFVAAQALAAPPPRGAPPV